MKQHKDIEKVCRLFRDCPLEWKYVIKQIPYRIQIKEDGNYILLHYDTGKSDFSYELVRECRGLIVDKNTLEPLALSYTKFFNYGESGAAEIDWDGAKVYEKIDGTRIMLWWDRGEWHKSTTTTIDAYKASATTDKTYGELFDFASTRYQGFYERLDKNIIYTFELVSPFTRIVIDYPETKIYLIGMRRADTFEEISIDTCDLFEKPRKYDLRCLEDVVALADSLNAGEDITDEGFVVTDKHFNRIKVKSPKFFAVYRINKGFIVDMLTSGDLSEYLSYNPHMTAIFKSANKSLQTYLKGGIKALNDYLKYIRGKDITRREIATYALTQHKDYSDVIFKYIDNTDKKPVEFMDEYWKRMPQDKRIKIIYGTNN